MIKINLIFDRKAIERGRVKQELILGLILVFVTVGVSGFLWYYQETLIDDVNKNIDDSKTKLNSLKAVINKINDREKKKKRLEEIIKAIGELKRVQRGPARVFDEINMILPPEIWLTSLSESGGQIRLDGYSFSNPGIATFMENIKSSRYFFDVELLEIQQTTLEGEKVKKFVLNSTLNLSPEDKALVSRFAKGGGGAGGGGGFKVMPGSPLYQLYSKEGTEEYGKKMAEDLKSAPRNPFVEAFKYGQLPQDQEGIQGPNIEAAKERADRLKGESEQKRKEVEERVRQMEGNR
ncbi:MAG: PilN domain-containing protein [Nitrospinae bacterium]|nr:PilN domain-containing protein [Nitrospinota bacterium]